MTRFSSWPLEERRTAVQEAAARLGALPIIVEKDY